MSSREKQCQKIAANKTSNAPVHAAHHCFCSLDWAVLCRVCFRLVELLVAGKIELDDALKLLVVDDADLAVAYGYTSGLKV